MFKHIAYVLAFVLTSANAEVNNETKTPTHKQIPTENKAELLSADAWEDELSSTDKPPHADLLAADNWQDEEDKKQTKKTTNWYQLWKKYAKLALNHHLASNTHADIQQQRSSANLQLEASLSPSLFVHIKGRLRYYHKQDNALIPANKPLTQAQLQQAWVQWSKGILSAKLGKQKLILGSVDGAQALDVISPIDMTEPLLTDLDNIRLGQTMGLFSLYAKQQKLSLFYIPTAQFNRFSLDGLTAYLKRQAPFAQMRFNPNKGNDEFGMRYQLQLPQWDLALIAAKLVHNNPISRLTHTGLSFQQQSYHLIGISSSYAIDSWLINTDLSHKSQQLFSLSPTAPLSNSLEAALGIEYLSPSQHSFKASLYNRKNLSNKQTEKPTVSLSWSKNYLNDDLALSALAFKQLQSQAMQATLLVNYKINDIWQMGMAYSQIETPNKQDAAKYGIMRKHIISFNLGATF